MPDIYHDQRMEQVPVKPGSVAKARLRAERLHREGLDESQRSQNPGNGLESFQTPIVSSATGPSKSPKTRQHPALDSDGVQIISRPTQTPQWPFSGKSSSPAAAPGLGTHHSPHGDVVQAPQRPPRPSRIPSMTNQARVQDSTPLFMAPVRTSENSPEYETAGGQPFSPISEYSTTQPSTTGYLSELPLSNPSLQAPYSKRGSIFGPPPSSRRGASSFYSNASFVSPIIEESPNTRSHGSYASSAAMPEAWGTGMPRSSRGYGDAFYEESITDSRDSTFEFGDESHLMESAKADNRLKPEQILRHSVRQETSRKPTYLDAKGAGGTLDSAEASMTSWNPSATSKQTPETSLGTINNAALITGKVFNPFTEENSPIPDLDKSAKSPIPFSSRNSAMKRPPKLDMDAVRAAESRGSLTSLPDLIRRATRLAAMIDKGKRPSSRLDDLTEYLDEKGAGPKDRNKEFQTRGRPPSGLSDMLAAFPPPVQTPQNNGSGRGSWLRPNSWPLVPGSNQNAKNNSSNVPNRRRRCCGLPVWAFILVTILLLCVIVAAIVVPLEIFVFKNIGSYEEDDVSIQSCQKKLSCLNGGTNVVSQGSCSCICTGGFTGPDCRTGGSIGCTTTNLISTDGSSEIKNVTLGQAIPRLIAGANSNFSLSLSGAAILAKFNNADLSCIAQNSLVTFNGKSARLSSRDFKRTGIKEEMNTHSMRRSGGGLTGHPSDHSNTYETLLTNPHSSTSNEDTGAIVIRQDDSQEFVTTDNSLDFSRVAVLFVLQEKGLDDAQNAQSKLQIFFTKVTQAQNSREQQITKDEARNITLNGDITVSLVDLTIDMGSGKILGRSSGNG